MRVLTLVELLAEITPDSVRTATDSQIGCLPFSPVLNAIVAYKTMVLPLQHSSSL
jgi:hypothetical protein